MTPRTRKYFTPKTVAKKPQSACANMISAMIEMQKKHPISHEFPSEFNKQVTLDLFNAIMKY